MKEPEVSLSDVGAFVPFPAALLDEQMPRLKDTEWKLLCVIVRQTLGWQKGKGRKKRDWMTQKQLMKRTGRASAALSAALDVLVRENLVECYDSEGETLLSPRHRRNHRGRVYFSLAPRLLQSVTVAAPKSRDRCDIGYFERPVENGSRVFNGWIKAGHIAETNKLNRSANLSSPASALNGTEQIHETLT